MIPTKRDNFEVTSTIEGNVIGMKIDENSVHHIMAVLTDLYSDAEMAVIREYATNAFDAHVEAGNPMPIEVTTPTSLAPFLRVKDNGVGLDAYDIENIYSKYGFSTKTHTNDQTGVLGLGCKSALTYTNQFTVVGVKDGVRTSVAVGRDDEGVGTMTIVDMSETEDANGVEIIVPAKTHSTFKEKAYKLFRFWPKGSVLLDGEEVEPIPGLVITPEIRLVKRDQRGYDPYGNGRYYGRTESYVVMGKVPYPIDVKQIDFDLPEEYGVLATVPNGSMHFTPSREALHYTRMTKEALEKLKQDLTQGLQDAITKEIDAAATRGEAMRVLLRWRTALPKAMRSMPFSYHGAEIPDSIVAPDGGATFVVSKGKDERDYYNKRIKVGAHSSFHSIDLTMVSDALWVYNFNRSFTASAKKKMWMWCDQKNRAYPGNFICCQSKPQSPWIHPDNMVDWTKEIEPLKLPRTNAAGRTLHTGRIAGSYDCMICTDGDLTYAEETSGDDIDPDMPIYYMVDKFASIKPTAKHLAMVLDDFTLVALTGNRVAKFLRLFPEAQHPKVTLNEAYQAFIESLTAQEKRALALRVNGVSRTLDADWMPKRGIKDPAIAELLRLRNWNLGYVNRLFKMYEVFGFWMVRRSEGDLPEVDLDVTERYPLCHTYTYGSGVKRTVAHNLVYMNAAYEAFYKDQDKENH